MAIKHVNGDLTIPESFIQDFDHDKDNVFLVHQTNPFGIMGAGVALSLATKYPSILPDYEKYCSSNLLKEILGTALFTYTGIMSTCVVNLFGQDSLNSERDTNYEAIYQALEEFFSFMPDYPKWCIAFPKNMSSALAGAKWEIIYSMIESLSKDLPNTVYIVNYVPVNKEVCSHATSSE